MRENITSIELPPDPERFTIGKSFIGRKAILDKRNDVTAATIDFFYSEEDMEIFTEMLNQYYEEGKEDGRNNK